MSKTRKQGDNLTSIKEVIPRILGILFLTITGAAASYAQLNLQEKPIDTTYLSECENLEWKSDEIKTLSRLSLISDLVFPDSNNWTKFSDLPKLEDKFTYDNISSRLIRFIFDSNPSSYLTLHRGVDSISKEIFEFFRYVPMQAGYQIVYSGPLLVLDGNFSKIIPDNPSLDLLDVNQSRILRVNRISPLDTEYVGAYWSYVSGSHDEHLNRGTIYPSTQSERVESTGFLCLPEKAKKIRIETNLEPTEHNIVRFSPNIGSSDIFFPFAPNIGNMLGKYEGGKTNIIMAHKESARIAWALIQFDFKKLDSNILSSRIGWIQVDDLNLRKEQKTLIENSLR